MPIRNRTRYAAGLNAFKPAGAGADTTALLALAASVVGIAAGDSLADHAGLEHAIARQEAAASGQIVAAAVYGP